MPKSDFVNVVQKGQEHPDRQPSQQQDKKLIAVKAPTLQNCLKLLCVAPQKTRPGLHYGYRTSTLEFFLKLGQGKGKAGRGVHASGQDLKVDTSSQSSHSS
jgi:hypothetical protein